MTENNPETQIVSTNELQKKASLIKAHLKMCFPSTHFKISHTKEHKKMCIHIDWYGKPDIFDIFHTLYEFNCGITYSHNGSATEIAILPYSQAITQENKQGNYIISTLVCWDKAAEQQLQLISFKTIPSRKILIPGTLPLGYEMIKHPSWLEIENELTNPYKIKEATFEEIDRLREDLYIYTKKINKRFDFEIDQNDYWDYLESIEATWEPLDMKVKGLDRIIEKKLMLAYPL